MNVCYTDTLKADCEDLLTRFQVTDSVRYEDFSALWREMKFSTIFHGKMGDVEKRNFSREALSTACHYFFPPYSFQIRVGALYLLYGLYNTQLCQPKEAIRLALKDWEEVEAFQQDVINAQHFDAVYILRKMFLTKVFHFTAMPHLLFYRIKQKMPRQEICEEFRDRTAKVNTLITTDALEEITNVHEHYQKMKCAISSDKTQPDKALSLIKQDLVSDLRNFALDFHEWQENRKRKLKHALKKEAHGMEEEKKEEEEDGAGEGSSQVNESSVRAQMLEKIKSKSYGHVTEAPKSRRHRQVELESSGSGSDQGKVEKGGGKRRRLAEKGKKALKKYEVKHEVAMETDPQRLSMPMIAEEDDSDTKEVIPPPKRRRKR
ncbi:snRNA-activating protein complex subunit 1-like isoform X1 [Acipenser ruthenus]|uniref:snRNA-activating protein complex subunit 1-like isoform X1 n=1 Tax=Acipenser ruthenus TaxID=7906 RepID=UPI0027420CD6|nr:snRNA-activating protein complex subunit 1-like isoform X1 [Acipenser ruthenus]XP_058843969.1 snRNA-activating protein complex subunit 1-like isoform X1 [Acipenser ruthenus]